jgi:hypothetical protein
MPSGLAPGPIENPKARPGGLPGPGGRIESRSAVRLMGGDGLVRDRNRSVTVTGAGTLDRARLGSLRWDDPGIVAHEFQSDRYGVQAALRGPQCHRKGRQDPDGRNGPRKDWASEKGPPPLLEQGLWRRQER